MSRGGVAGVVDSSACDAVDLLVPNHAVNGAEGPQEQEGAQIPQ